MATAYAALVSLFNNLELIQNHPYHSFSFENKQIQSLGQSVSFLIDFMESCGYHGGSKEAAEYLERRIASAAHAADDVVESHVVDQIRGGSTQLDGKTRSRFLLDLQKVIEDMDFVRRKAMKVQKAQSGLKAEPPTYSAPASSSTPLTSQKNSMVGFDDVFDQLMDVLTGEHSSRQVTPIVGMGGIGKTTLARNVFENKSIVQHFDVRLWATISQEYSVEQILLQLLCHQRKSTGEIVNELGEQLYKKLWRRRYLIVLDDIWNVEAWDEIQLFFPDDGNQSRIVLTTRQRNVADCFGPLWLAMKFLNEGKSWNLFCEKAFAEQGCPLELEDIGKKIVQKCKGLPLAIIVVGSHLGKSSRMLAYWENVANNMNSILNSGENEQCLDILSLSYSHLPVHLKPCFLYMGTFLEDQHISMSDIVNLWIAEGFLKSSEAHSLEEVARDYLKDLINRNLISATTRTCNGEALTCKIHDLLRELCLKIAKKEKFFDVIDTPRAIHIHRERRVVINEKIPEEKYFEIFDAPSPRSTPLVRSLKCRGGRQSFDLRLLRVLNGVDRASMKEVDGGFLEANCRQVNLRYLRCSEEEPDDYRRRRSFYLYLPSPISMFWNLQTLIIEGINIKVIAPFEIWEMPQLRHFVSYLISLPDPLPSDRFDQPNELVLQNVQIVENFRLSEQVCKRIPHIKELRVAYCNIRSECDEPRQQYCPHNLGRLHALESLGFSFSKDPEWRDFALHLTFPNSLKELYLMNFHLRWEELTIMIGSLPNLEVLYLSGVRAGPKWDPIQGGFPCLKSLSIYRCPNLIFWNAYNSDFPVLEYLFLGQLSKLDGFPSGIGEIPTLRHIKLINCSEFLALSAVRMLVEQEEYGNEGVKLEVYFSDDENEESFKKKVQQDGLTSNNLYV